MIKNVITGNKIVSRILDVAEVYDTDIMYEVLKKVIEGLDRVEKERKKYGRQFQDAILNSTTSRNTVPKGSAERPQQR